MTSHFVIMIAGPTGVGKTTLAKMLSNYYQCAYIAEDEITKKAFPGVYKDNPDMVKTAESQLLQRTKEIFAGGECVVIDRINLGKEFIEEIRKTFQEQLILKVLWPPMKITVARDKRRAGWTSGKITIKRYYKIYEELKPIIGEKNYIDNGDQTPEETLESMIASIEESLLRYENK